MSRSLWEKKREEVAHLNTNGGVGIGVRSSPRRVVGAAGAAERGCEKEMHQGGEKENDDGRGADRERLRRHEGAVLPEKAKGERGAVVRRCGTGADDAPGAERSGEAEKGPGAPVVAKDPGDPLKDMLGTLLRTMVEIELSRQRHGRDKNSSRHGEARLGSSGRVCAGNIPAAADPDGLRRSSLLWLVKAGSNWQGPAEGLQEAPQTRGSIGTTELRRRLLHGAIPLHF
ncbi:hypothetical protein KFL_001710020 [Klebsormidium nitens]|uniref:Uncharacterized protein n=1 Tax=Klebsormidium nitens TaxID=105231 RepID=A0A1Y1I1Y8_KLENI|nr:hypothetical protein KFL_001710020 [Klebsormidium nitens]|eukprot:GAQ83972.1 hypothetical protein KFL_001710020 [Klebsormidium nitens]